MPDLTDGESVEVQGSGSKPYVLKNSGGVYSCTCPAWRNQSAGIERRTCKHLRKLRGDAAEEERLGGALPARPEPTTAGGATASGPPILLAESWDGTQDPAGWWMSEKLDGVRAYWDGARFLSRQGNTYHAPDWFARGLPGTPLDGELWIGRKQFQRTVGVVRRQDKNDLWREVKYVVFDAPGHAGPFEERLDALKAALTSGGDPHCELLGHDRCRGLDHLREELRRVESLGGEGLMLRQPGSGYAAGRSGTLLKVKSFLDADAVVVGHEPGRGRHAGRLGAVVARLPGGKTFSIGTGFSDRERADPPPVGAVVTFRYQELSEAGIPRFPSFLRVRADVDEIEPAALVTAPPAGAPKVPAAAPPAAATGAGQVRRFEFRDGGSGKFWEIALTGATVTTRWGKIGTAGQEKSKALPTEEKARQECDELVEEKTGKGYTEQ